MNKEKKSDKFLKKIELSVSFHPLFKKIFWQKHQTKSSNSTEI
jgi:hypothetical protein